MTTTTHVLVVEDEAKLATLLRDYLRAEGYATEVLDNGNLVVPWVKQHRTDAILLDVMLPGLDGLSVCRQLRAFTTVPILMVTARVEEIDRLLGLELGADDYICKPFSPREVIARVKAVLRRSRGALPGVTSALSIDVEKQQVHLHGIEVALTPVELRLLQALAARPGVVLSRQQLMNALYEDNRIVSDRTVDSHIKNLRKKLASANHEEELIASIYGVGYKLLL